MELKSESTPRDTTRRTIVFHPIKISGLCPEATLRWLRNVCRKRTPVRAAVFCRSPSVGGHAGRVTLPMWRPARRLGARRYVKELPSLCEGTAELYFIAPCGARGGSAKNMKPAPFGAAGKMARPIQMPASTAKKRVRHDAFGFLK